MKVSAIKTRVFKEGEDLLAFIGEHVSNLANGSVLVVTSKIVALAENRTVDKFDEAKKVEIIKQESQLAIKTKYVWLTVKDDMVMPSAGIDESNSDGKLILLPKDSYESAQVLHRKLREKYQIKDLGIIITDSRTAPFRSGVTGVAMGYAGFKGIKDYIGQTDIFNRPFKFSKVNIPDSLAAAAVLEMGEGNEQKPLAIITDVNIEYSETVDRKEVVIPPEDDMYGPLFKQI